MKYILKIKNKITSKAIRKIIIWKYYEKKLPLCYNRLNYPLFSVLWLYLVVGKFKTIEITSD